MALGVAAGCSAAHGDRAAQQATLRASCRGFADVLVTDRDRGGRRGEIALLHPDGSFGKVLTTKSMDPNHPSFSRDGTHVVFENMVGYDGETGPDASSLAVVDVNGLGLRRITGGPHWSEVPADHQNALGQGAGPWDEQPEWSPTTDDIVYSHRATPAGAQRLYLVEPGLDPRPLLTPSAGGDETTPAWSPDGKQIAFIRTQRSSREQAIWSANADGTGSHHVADLMTDSTPTLTWGPDASSLYLAHVAVPAGPAGVPFTIITVDVRSGATTATKTPGYAAVWSGDRLYAYSLVNRPHPSQLAWLRLTDGEIADVHTADLKHVLGTIDAVSCARVS